MVNKELMDLCRLIVAAISDTDSFSAVQLKKLLLHIVPQLLAEIDILAAVAESLSQKPQEPDEEAEEPAAPVAEPVPAAPKAKKQGRRARADRRKKRVR
jgi:hypothetical protein